MSSYSTFSTREAVIGVLAMAAARAGRHKTEIKGGNNTSTPLNLSNRPSRKLTLKHMCRHTILPILIYIPC